MIGKKIRFIIGLKKIERQLLKENTTRAEKMALDMKRKVSDHDTSSNRYLLDYYHAQAIFRTENTSEQPDIERIEESISLYKSSIEKNSTYADAHFQLGLAYLLQTAIKRIRHIESDISELESNSKNHLCLARAHNPDYTEIVDRLL